MTQRSNYTRIVLLSYCLHRCSPSVLCVYRVILYCYYGCVGIVTSVRQCEPNTRINNAKPIPAAATNITRMTVRTTGRHYIRYIIVFFHNACLIFTIIRTNSRYVSRELLTVHRYIIGIYIY